jgi:hypothetical protein
MMIHWSNRDLLLFLQKLKYNLKNVDLFYTRQVVIYLIKPCRSINKTQVIILKFVYNLKVQTIVRINKIKIRLE